MGKSLKKIRSQARLPESGIIFYAPTHDVAPSAVTMAVATDAMICTINLMVSFLLIMFNVSLGFAAWLRQECLMFNVKAGWGCAPIP